MTTILGISAYYHDSAACCVRDGTIVAAAQEERFTRKRHDPRFPSQAVRYCCREAGVHPREIDFVAFYDKPLLKFERLLETYLAFAPRGWRSFVTAMPVWMKEKLFLPTLLERELNRAFDLTRCARIKWRDKLLFTEHHQSHAASAFFPSPFPSAAIVTMDGVGEWATSTVGRGSGNALDILYEQHFPHSPGLLYSAMTYYTGFKVNSGEYKVMGLAPYGEPKYVRTIYDHLIDLKDDGSFRLNLDYFDFCTGLTMTNARFDALFGGPPRAPETPLTQREMDLARSIQEVIEEIVVRTARHARKETGEADLCLAGGVALNCVANGRILRDGIARNVWIQPAAGDAGGALGAALATWHQYLGRERRVDGATDRMQGAYLGPAYPRHAIETFLAGRKIPYRRMEEDELLSYVADLLVAEKVVGWFHGRMEFGPRALGARSILGNARSPSMQSVMNLKIKYRESFRPFAPAVLRERMGEYFAMDADSPYMLLVAPVREEWRRPVPRESATLWGIDRLNVPRSSIPGVTHVDYSARVQTVHRATNPRFYDLIEQFAARTGTPVVINTSFNVRGEPIVCTPEDAYRCFMRTAIDCLVLEDCVLDKSDQPMMKENDEWRHEFALD